MQVEAALRSPALAMQLSNVVKTFVLRATKVPERTREHDGDDQRQDAAHDPCDGLSGVRRAHGPSAGEGNPAQDGRDQASQQARREQDEGHGGHQAGHAEDQGGYAQAEAVPRPG